MPHLFYLALDFHHGEQPSDISLNTEISLHTSAMVKYLLLGPTAVSTQAVRKVLTKAAQVGSAFQLRQFLESVTENARLLNLT